MVLESPWKSSSFVFWSLYRPCVRNECSEQISNCTQRWHLGKAHGTASNGMHCLVQSGVQEAALCEHGLYCAIAVPAESCARAGQSCACMLQSVGAEPHS